MNQMSDPLPACVTTLLDRLESVLQLEILITLRDSSEPLTAQQLNRRIGGSVEQVERCLASLTRQGFAIAQEDHPGPSFSYRSGGHDEDVELLAELYVTRKVRVVSQLFR